MCKLRITSFLPSNFASDVSDSIARLGALVAKLAGGAASTCDLAFFAVMTPNVANVYVDCCVPKDPKERNAARIKSCGRGCDFCSKHARRKRRPSRNPRFANVDVSELFKSVNLIQILKSARSGLISSIWFANSVSIFVPKLSPLAKNWVIQANDALQKR